MAITKVSRKGLDKRQLRGIRRRIARKFLYRLDKNFQLTRALLLIHRFPSAHWSLHAIDEQIAYFAPAPRDPDPELNDLIDATRYAVANAFRVPQHLL